MRVDRLGYCAWMGEAWSLDDRLGGEGVRRQLWWELESRGGIEGRRSRSRNSHAGWGDGLHGGFGGRRWGWGVHGRCLYGLGRGLQRWVHVHSLDGLGRGLQRTAHVHSLYDLGSREFGEGSPSGCALPLESHTEVDRIEDHRSPGLEGHGFESLEREEENEERRSRMPGLCACGSTHRALGLRSVRCRNRPLLLIWRVAVWFEFVRFASLKVVFVDVSDTGGGLLCVRDGLFHDEGECLYMVVGMGVIKVNVVFSYLTKRA